jgi:hypothetical protein
MNEVWQQVWIAVQPVLISALIAVVAMLIRAIQRWVEGKIATDRYRKQIGIVADAILAVAQKLGLQWSDGNWTKEEKTEIKRDALKIIESRFSALRGVVLKEAMDWAETQIDAELGKLEARLLGITSPEELTGDEEAVEE